MTFSCLKNIHILQLAFTLIVVKFVNGKIHLLIAPKEQVQIAPVHIAKNLFLNSLQCSHSCFGKYSLQLRTHVQARKSRGINSYAFITRFPFERKLCKQRYFEEEYYTSLASFKSKFDPSSSLALYSTRISMTRATIARNSETSFTLLSLCDFPLYATFKHLFEQINKFFFVLWSFGRPHTLIGTTMAVIALHVAAMPENVIVNIKDTISSFIGALISSLCMNIYVTGLNQVTDIGIDQINKPYLPIPAKFLQVRSAVLLSLVTLFTSFWIGVGRTVLPTTYPLKVTLLLSFLIGTLYSLPPIRLKHYSVLAAACIVSVRGILANLGIYAHVKQAAFHVQFPFTLHSFLKDYKGLLITTYFSLYGTLIAILKDVPDLKGDKQFGIRNFTVKLGPKTVFKFCRRMLEVILSSAGVVLSFSAFCVAQRIPLNLWNFFLSCSDLQFSSLFTTIWMMKILNRRTLVWFHSLFSRSFAAYMAFLLARKFKIYGEQTNAKCAEEVTEFYMNVWKLFYLSYATLILLR